MGSVWSNSCILTNMRSHNRNTFLAVFVLGVAIITFLFAYAAFGQETSHSDTLRQVHILFRHGDKTPGGTYPNDPYKDHKLLSLGLGELTKKGKRQMYDLGLTLRKRYGEFLGEYLSLQDIEVRSSYAGRCQMSVQVLLAAMFPPVGDQIWNPNLLWQPVPINSVPRKFDNVIAAKADCPAFTIEKYKSDSELNSNLSHESRDLFTYLTEHTGQPVTNISAVESLYNILSIQKDNNLVLPKWTEGVFPEPMKQMAAENLASFTRTALLKKLKAGPLLSEWVNHMDKKKSSGMNAKKMYLYSGHDLTIINALRGLSIDHIQLPQYGATLILELHHIHQLYYVKLFYLNSSSSTDAKLLSLPGCDSSCSFDTFVELTKTVIPVDWEKECKLS